MEVCVFKVSRESNLFENISYLIRKPSGNKCNILRIILCFHLVKFFFDFVLAGLLFPCTFNNDAIIKICKCSLYDKYISFF